MIKLKSLSRNLSSSLRFGLSFGPGLSPSKSTANAKAGANAKAKAKAKAKTNAKTKANDVPTRTAMRQTKRTQTSCERFGIACVGPLVFCRKPVVSDRQWPHAMYPLGFADSRARRGDQGKGVH